MDANKCQQHLVMDANKSEAFANFLNVSRTFGLTCVYIFYTIYPTKQNWQMILAQTKTFNNFPDSVQTSSIVKILSFFCSQYKHNYAPNRDLWINRQYFNISNSAKKSCLTIDTKDVNDLRPSSLGPKLTTTRNRSAVIITTKELLALILS